MLRSVWLTFIPRASGSYECIQQSDESSILNAAILRCEPSRLVWRIELVRPTACCWLVEDAVRQRKNSLFFLAVFQRMEAPNLIEAALAVESTELMGVARYELARLQIAATQICFPERFRALPHKKM